MSTNPLVGKVITDIQIAADLEAIRFVLADGEAIVAHCDVDCCSHTWIEDVLDPSAVIGSEVLRADDIDLPEEFHTPTKTDNGEEEMRYYGFLIETAKGRCTLAYRNSSNGYYGGNLSWPGDYHYGGVFGQNRSGEKWTSVIEGEAKAA